MKHFFEFMRKPRVHRSCQLLMLVSTLFLAGQLLCACGVPTWLTDAQNILALATSSAGAILGFFGTLSGNPALAAAAALLTGIFTDIEKGITDVETLVSEYNENPSDTLLQNIEAGAQLVITNLKKVLTDAFPEVPAALVTKVQAVAQLLLTQFEAWSSLIPAAKAALTAGSQITISVPYTSKAYKKLFNDTFATPTGDAAIDEALPKVKRL